MSTERDARIDDLIEANKEAERYAGDMERALENIRSVCLIARKAGSVGEGDDGELAETLYEAINLIHTLALVRDSRKQIATYAPKQG